ncbi:hypothetical protein [Naasia lichenicola]|uniref:hypothetical protein n=1 Tax=Naasia lichenicola TaxID=2565933 RepID=UPI00130E9CCD|nr:hypothetical protein [Naasia lichenicola]
MTLTIDAPPPAFSAPVAPGAPIPSVSFEYETLVRAVVSVSFVLVRPSDSLITAIPAL